MSTELNAIAIAKEIFRRLDDLSVQFGTLDVQPSHSVKAEDGEFKEREKLDVYLRGTDGTIVVSLHKDPWDYPDAPDCEIDIDAAIQEVVEDAKALSDPEVCECCGRPHKEKK